MAKQLIFQFQQQLDPVTYRIYTVSRDTDNFSLITVVEQVQFGNPGLPDKSAYTDGDNISSPVCYGYDKITYKFQTASPYSYPDPEYNSPFCEFPTTPCDIAFFGIPIVTHETGPSADDGSVQVFATSSRTPSIQYRISNISGTFVETNTIGKFYNLPPQLYEVLASEVGDVTCAVGIQVNVNAYDPTLTNYKYRIQFDSLQGRTVEVRLIDTNNLYPIADYPIDLIGTDKPLQYQKELTNEDKTSHFATATLSMTPYYDGSFTIDEFSRAPEEAWRVEMYYDSDLEFQGYLLPDQTKDKYADPNYPINLVATDGVPSLKGKGFGDLSLYTNDTNGDPIYKKLYGLQKWSYLIKICLEHLGYDYGEVLLVNSLQYDLTYDVDIWINSAFWGDIFYNDNDEPVSVYEALEILLGSVNLCMVQHKGSFVLISWNDLYYINKPAKATEYTQSFWRFSHDFTYLVSYGPIVGSNPVERPNLLSIGKGQQLKPIGANGDIDYDQSYGVMEANIDFDILALLYQDPSFEYNQNLGDIPNDWSKEGTINTFITDEQAYTGLNSLKVDDVIWNVGGSNTNYIYYAFPVDQFNKKVVISFYWLPVYIDDNSTTNPMFQVFLDGDNGLFYEYTNNSIEPEAERNTWREIPSSRGAQSSPNQDPNYRTSDYIGWNAYTLTTARLPTPGIVSITIKRPTLVGDEFPAGNLSYYLDDLNISTSDANEAYTFQTGEIHRITNYTSYSQAEKRTIDLPLFTYPSNKRLAGNWFTENDYLAGDVQNKYSFATSPSLVNDRLPAAVIKAISRNYQRPMYKYSGEVKGDNIQFYALFSLVAYDVIFMPFSIETDLRNSVSTVVLCELEDALAQSRYTYVAKYEKNARKNSS